MRGLERDREPAPADGDRVRGRCTAALAAVPPSKTGLLATLKRAVFGESDSSSYYYYYISGPRHPSQPSSSVSPASSCGNAAVTHGDFILASGRRSSFYIDARRTTMSGEGLVVIGHARGLRASRHALGARPGRGLTLGADPSPTPSPSQPGPAVGHSTPSASGKQAKTHGTGKRIEGCFTPGAAVVVVEDVLTTGHSAAEAIAAVIAEGGRVLACWPSWPGRKAAGPCSSRQATPVEALVTATELGLRDGRLPLDRLKCMISPG